MISGDKADAIRIGVFERVLRSNQTHTAAGILSSQQWQRRRLSGILQPHGHRSPRGNRNRYFHTQPANTPLFVESFRFNHGGNPFAGRIRQHKAPHRIAR